jgi:flagellar biosynthesis protein FliQ
MTDAQVLHIISGALVVATKLAAPVLIVTLVIGVVVSIIQTVTQIQEQTLTFVPKLIGVAAIVVFGGAMMIRELVTWVTQLWQMIPSVT